MQSKLLSGKHGRMNRKIDRWTWRIGRIVVPRRNVFARSQHVTAKVAITNVTRRGIGSARRQTVAHLGRPMTGFAGMERTALPKLKMRIGRLHVTLTSKAAKSIPPIVPRLSAAVYVDICLIDVSRLFAVVYGCICRLKISWESVAARGDAGGQLDRLHDRWVHGHSRAKSSLRGRSCRLFR